MKCSIVQVLVLPQTMLVWKEGQTVWMVIENLYSWVKEMMTEFFKSKSEAV